MAFSCTLQYGGLEVLDVATAIENAAEHGTPMEFYGRANGYTCPRGKEPGVAWILMLREDADELDMNESGNLIWREVEINGETGAIIREVATKTFRSLYQVRRLAMNLIYEGDPEACYLLELADKRKILAMSVANKKYNVRMPAPSATTGVNLYYSESLNAGSLWTWQTLLSDLWALLPSIAGTAPTLPYSPDGNPEGWKFYGVSAWDAIHEVLDVIGCTTTYDPFTGDFAYVRHSDEQSDLGAIPNLASALSYDYDPAGSEAAHIPETIRVFFHRKDREAGIELDTPRTGSFSMATPYSVDVATSVAGAITGTVAAIWNDLPALYDTSGALENGAALTTRANEAAANYLAKLRVEAAPTSRTYDGVHDDVLTGSEINEVAWADYGRGWETKISNRRKPKAGDGVMRASTQLLPPTHNAKLHPNWPRTDQVVQVWDGATTLGYQIAQNGDNLVAGRVVQFAGIPTALDDCWILIVDNYGIASGDIPAISGDYHIGRLYGVTTSGGTTKPLYIVHRGGKSIFWQYSLSEDWGATTANQATADQLTLQDGTDTGVNVTLYGRPEDEIDGLVAQDIVLGFEQNGNHYAIVAAAGVRFSQYQLKEDWGATTADQATCDRLDLFTGADTGEDVIVYSRPESMFDALTTGDKVLGFKQDGKHYGVTAPC